MSSGGGVTPVQPTHLDLPFPPVAPELFICDIQVLGFDETLHPGVGVNQSIHLPPMSQMVMCCIPTCTASKHCERGLARLLIKTLQTSPAHAVHRQSLLVFNSPTEAFDEHTLRRHNRRASRQQHQQVQHAYAVLCS